MEGGRQGVPWRSCCEVIEGVGVLLALAVRGEVKSIT